jgi:prepilin-type N-terminal cleavage/methylation domain-containing protein
MRLTKYSSSKKPGFTLIELLVVISIIAILAALVFPATAVVKKKQMISVAQAELKQVQTAIEAYKAKTGQYPPDNPNSVYINPLYFELQGTVFNGGIYQTIDGSSQIPAANLGAVFGAGISGFVNSSTKTNGNDDAAGPKSFLKETRFTQFGKLVIGGETNNAILVTSIRWPDASTQPIATPPGAEDGLNPWRYVSSHPTNNPSSYDLWVDILIGKKIYRISNWSGKPEIF